MVIFDGLFMKWENDTFGLVLRMRQMVYSSKDFESLLEKTPHYGSRNTSPKSLLSEMAKSLGYKDLK